MKRIWIVTAILSVFLAGCNNKQESVTVMLEGSPETAKTVKTWLETKPQIIEPVLGDRYIVKIIPPDSTIEHKMNIITPDPDIDFKIGIINPYGEELSSELKKKLNDAFREQIEKSKKP